MSALVRSRTTPASWPAKQWPKPRKKPAELSLKPRRPRRHRPPPSRSPRPRLTPHRNLTRALLLRRRKPLLSWLALSRRLRQSSLMPSRSRSRPVKRASKGQTSMSWPGELSKQQRRAPRRSLLVPTPLRQRHPRTQPGYALKPPLQQLKPGRGWRPPAPRRPSSAPRQTYSSPRPSRRSPRLGTKPRPQLQSLRLASRC